MTAKFLYKGKVGRALMGEVLNVIKPLPSCKPAYRRTFLEIKITSYEDKRDKKLVGTCFLVDKNVCQIQEMS